MTHPVKAGYSRPLIRVVINGSLDANISVVILFYIALGNMFIVVLI